jgi:hypothetical protein
MERLAMGATHLTNSANNKADRSSSLSDHKTVDASTSKRAGASQAATYPKQLESYAEVEPGKTFSRPGHQAEHTKRILAKDEVGSFSSGMTSESLASVKQREKENRSTAQDAIHGGGRNEK